MQKSLYIIIADLLTYTVCTKRAHVTSTFVNILKGHVPASVVIAALVIAILVPKIDYYFAYSCQSKYARPGLPSPSQLIAADRDVTKVGGNSSRILEPNCDWYYFGTCMRYSALCGHSEHAICVRALFC